MSRSTDFADRLFKELAPELKRLCANCPEFGELTLRVAIHDSGAGRISLGIETAKRIAARPNRGAT